MYCTHGPLLSWAAITGEQGMHLPIILIGEADGFWKFFILVRQTKNDRPTITTAEAD
jgi:hypothetical protein